VLLAREVRAVRDPDRERARAERAAEADAREVVRDRLLAHARVRVREAPELVRVRLAGQVLEGVRVHRVEAESEARGARAQLAGFVDRVPREAAGVGVARELPDQRAVLGFSNTSRGSPGTGKRAKRVPPVPTPQVGIATPARQALGDCVDRDPAPREAARRATVVASGTGAPAAGFA
jgi:hypothetical protein